MAQFYVKQKDKWDKNFDFEHHFFASCWKFKQFLAHLSQTRCVPCEGLEFVGIFVGDVDGLWLGVVVGADANNINTYLFV